MTPEDRILVLCSRQNFQDQHRQAVIGISKRFSINWECLFESAKEHGIGPLVGKNLLQCNGNDFKLPLEVVQCINLYIYSQVISSENRLRILRDGLEFLNKKQLRVMLVKGIAASLQVYNHPWYTVAKDIDIIIDRKQHELPPHELVQIGNHFHRTGIEYDFYEHHDININRVLPVDFNKIWQEAGPFLFRGQETLLMRPEDFLISLCINSSRKRYFRLKSLCDIAETIRKFESLAWENIIDNSKHYDCSWIVFTALRIVQLTTGTDLPENFLGRLGVNSFRASLINLTIHTFLNYFTPSQLANTSAKRKIRPALILSYLTYRGYQIRRKFEYARTQPPVKYH